MTKLKIAVVSPSGSFEQSRLDAALLKASRLGFDVFAQSEKREGGLTFLNGTKQERKNELVLAESLPVDGIWCVRGGCGAVELWQDYQPDMYAKSSAPLIGYSDITIFHFMRLYRAGRIGIHGPILLDLIEELPAHIEALGLLLQKQAEKLIYPALKPLTHFWHKTISGELVVMNLASLQTIVGCFDNNFLQGKILAIEDVNEPHYRVFRIINQLKNAGILTGLKALLLGYFGADRQPIIEETMAPIAAELGIPLFDWPIFGHEKPNWPLLFGAKVTISFVDEHFFTLAYDEQHDHTPITHEF